MTAYDKAAEGRGQKLCESPLWGLMQEENVRRTVEQSAHGPEVVIGRAPTGATGLTHDLCCILKGTRSFVFLKPPYFGRGQI